MAFSSLANCSLEASCEIHSRLSAYACLLLASMMTSSPMPSSSSEPFRLGITRKSSFSSAFETGSAGAGREGALRWIIWGLAAADSSALSVAASSLQPSIVAVATTIPAAMIPYLYNLLICIFLLRWILGFWLSGAVVRSCVGELVHMLTEQVVAIVSRDPCIDEISCFDPARTLKQHDAVDFRRIPVAASHDGGAVYLVYDDRLYIAHAAGQAGFADALLVLHEAMPAVVLEFFGHRVGQFVGGRAGDRGILEAADPLELRLAEPVEQYPEVVFGFARVADDEGRTDHQVRADVAPAADSLQGVLRRGRPAH